MPQLIRLNDLIIYWFIELMNLIDLIVYPYKSSICTIPVCFSFVVRYIIAFCSLFIAIFSLRFFTLFFCSIFRFHYQLTLPLILCNFKFKHFPACSQGGLKIKINWIRKIRRNSQKFSACEMPNVLDIKNCNNNCRFFLDKIHSSESELSCSKPRYRLYLTPQK